jgi:hypothetical protein
VAAVKNQRLFFLRISVLGGEVYSATVLQRTGKSEHNLHAYYTVPIANTCSNLLILLVNLEAKFEQVLSL